MHLSDHMAAKGLSDDDVAAAIGRSRVSVSRYRRKLVRPDWKTIDVIEDWSEGAVGPGDWRELIPEASEAAA